MKAGYGNLDASFKSSTPSSNSESENSITISLGNSTRGNSVITVILSLLFLNSRDFIVLTATTSQRLKAIKGYIGAFRFPPTKVKFSKRS